MLRSLTALAALALLAGCIAPPGSEGETEAADVDADLPPSSAGTMTVEDEQEDVSGELCVLQGTTDVLSPEPYCARRTIRVAGAIDLTALPVTVSVGAADVLAGEGDAGRWELVVTIVAHGATAEMAEAAARAEDVAWSIGQPGAHALSVEHRSESERPPQVAIALALPAAPLYSFAVDAGSGDVAMHGLRTAATEVDVGSGDVEIAEWRAASLVLSGGSGDARVDAEVAQVVVERGSGDVQAALRPFAPGSVVVSTGSGEVAIHVPEDATHGYDVTLSTGSGDAQIGLRDGRASGDEDAKRFTTTGYAARAVRTAVTVSTGSGDAAVGPD